MTSNKHHEVDDDVHENATEEQPGKKVNKHKHVNVEPYAHKDHGAPPAEGSTWSTQLCKGALLSPGPGQSKTKTRPPAILPPLVAPVNSRNVQTSQTLEERVQNSLLNAASGAIAGASEPPPVARSSNNRSPPMDINNQAMGDTSHRQEADQEDEDENAWVDEETEPRPKNRKKLPKDALKLLEELYDGKGDHSAYMSLTALLMLLQKSKGNATHQKPRKSAWGKKDKQKIPWTQEGSYECSTGMQHRDKELVALVGYIWMMILELMDRKSPKDPLPRPPPPHVSAPTDTAFYVDWNQNMRLLFNATAARIVAVQVAKDWPNLYEPDDEHLFDMVIQHIKYLQTCYWHQNDQTRAAKEAE
ncbi:hypothetical protein FRC11_012651 [Ceratobasidium sp. 423]|nr:hypothetical protein FRC11_012651 [Ceratobasidium sp. 423]